MPADAFNNPTQPRAKAKVLDGVYADSSPKTSPLPRWQDEDVYIIGGGPSLRSFDFDQLVGLNTIGCNQAFMLGADICTMCAWGDLRFWEVFERDLGCFGGWVVTCYPLPRPPGWLRVFPRLQDGLSGDMDQIAWNGNTGAMAINLALLLGARRVYLLGFDAGRTKENHHWHDAHIEVPVNEVYKKFADGFDMVAGKLPSVFPGREVINVTDGSSRLESFPRRTFGQVFGR